MRRLQRLPALHMMLFRNNRSRKASSESPFAYLVRFLQKSLKSSLFRTIFVQSTIYVPPGRFCGERGSLVGRGTGRFATLRGRL